MTDEATFGSNSQQNPFTFENFADGILNRPEGASCTQAGKTAECKSRACGIVRDAGSDQYQCCQKTRGTGEKLRHSSRTRNFNEIIHYFDLAGWYCLNQPAGGACDNDDSCLCNHRCIGAGTSAAVCHDCGKPNNPCGLTDTDHHEAQKIKQNYVKAGFDQQTKYVFLQQITTVQ